MNFAALIMLVLAPGLAWMTGKRALAGLREGQVVFFGGRRDWGPFSREDEPVVYWFSMAWLIFWCVVSLILIVAIFTGDAGSFSLNADW